MKTKKKPKKQNEPPILIQLMRNRGMITTELRDKLGVTYPTLRVWLYEPMKMNGTTRAELARILRIPIDRMDDIVNGRAKSIDDVLEYKKTA